jgi:hypothetical protein
MTWASDQADPRLSCRVVSFWCRLSGEFPATGGRETMCLYPGWTACAGFPAWEVSGRKPEAVHEHGRGCGTVPG